MKANLLLLAALASIAATAPAQTAKLLKDVNQLPIRTPSNPNPVPAQTWTGIQTFSQMGKVVLLSAYTQTTGYELFATDGTTAGTKILKDINPSAASSWPSHIRVTNDGKRAFFSANDGKSGYELWTTDGTSTGTKLVKDLYVGTRSSNPYEIVAFGTSSVIFRAYTRTTGSEVFISDGTRPRVVLGGPSRRRARDLVVVPRTRETPRHGVFSFPLLDDNDRERAGFYDTEPPTDDDIKRLVKTLRDRVLRLLRKRGKPASPSLV